MRSSPRLTRLCARSAGTHASLTRSVGKLDGFAVSLARASSGSAREVSRTFSAAQASLELAHERDLRLQPVSVELQDPFTNPERSLTGEKNPDATILASQ